MNTQVATIAQRPNAGLVAKLAERFSVEPEKMMATLKATAFKVRDGEVTNEQMMALLVVADQYKLNPFTKELFAFPDKGGIVPVVSVDGWARIINEHPAMDGVEFVDGPEENGIPAWIECVIFRKDRTHPTKARERFKEVRRDTQPWKSHPARMLRHKALIQCARIAFGFAGIYEQDEAERIIEMGSAEVVPARTIQQPSAQRPAEHEQTEQTGQEQSTGTGAPIGESPLRMIRAQLEKAGLTDAECCKHFGIEKLEALTMDKINTVFAWIASPNG